MSSSESNPLLNTDNQSACSFTCKYVRRQIWFWFNLMISMLSILISTFCIVGVSYGTLSADLPVYIVVIGIFAGNIGALLVLVVSIILFVLIASEINTETISKSIFCAALFSAAIAGFVINTQIFGVTEVYFRYGKFAFNFYTFGIGFAIEAMIVFMLAAITIAASIIVFVMALLRKLRDKCYEYN